jgi:LPS-assembly protein
MTDDMFRRGRRRKRAAILVPALILGLILPAAAQKAKNKQKNVPSQKGAQAARVPQKKAAEAGAPAKEAGPPELRMLAESWKSTPDDHLIAWGNVEIHYGAVTLFADNVDLDNKTKDVQAVGHVVIQSPNEVTTADSLSFNLDTALGRMENAVGLAQPSLFYHAGLLEREQSDYYHFVRASFTTCTQPNPRWRFSCATANYKKDEYVEMWGTVLSIKGVPVFYFPYFRYPIRDRTTGLLQPKIGHTNIKGWKYTQDFYLAIARNMDATFNLTYYGAKGLGLGLEYRYLFADGTGGEIHLFDFSFKKTEAGVKPENAYIIRVKHNQNLPLGFQFVADVDIQSSYNFLREFDDNFNRATVSNRRSEAYLTKYFSGFAFSARASRFETNYASVNNSIITEYLPQISLNSFKIKLFDPLFFSFSSTFSRWQYGWQTDFDKNKQKRLQSFNLKPTISLPFTAIPWLDITASVSENLNYYWQSLVPVPGHPNQRQIGDEPFFSHNFDFILDFRGPTIYRVYNNSAGEAKVKHIIEPFVTYHYDSPTLNSDRIVTAVGFFRYHTITYGLTNHLLVKEGKMPREMLTFGLSQTHYFDAEEGPLSRYRFNDRIPDVSDISTFLRVFPSNAYSLDFTANYNTYHNVFSSIRLGARLGRPSDNFFLNASWFKGINPWKDQLFANRHQVNVFGGLKFPALNIEAQGEVAYNILDKQLLFAGINGIYHYQCVDFEVDVRIFNYRQVKDVQFSFSFGLANLGHSADFLGGLGF